MAGISYILCFLCVISVLCRLIAGQCPVNLKLLCYEQTNCGDCIRVHPCCHWCYEQTNFTGPYRCNFLNELESCGTRIERNRESSIGIIEDNDFSQIQRARDATKAIQIKPQSFKVTLRQDSPVNLTFIYKAAKNYPLELYYLGDLSYSMRNHLETLKNLGDDLGKSLENLTLHYRLAYGSFLDKPGMPFIYTDQKNRDNPCLTDTEKCEEAYLFKHRLNFTSNIESFFEEVRNSKISANVDDLDGALEAIFQILVCNRRFQWSQFSRKLILLSTDSLLHAAGDGILAGASAVNYKELCLVNSKGDHVAPLKYDYPSLGHIKSLLNKFKVNLIVAVTKDKIKSYKKMKQDILEQEAYVGELQENSKNILELVKTGYYNFIRQVEFSANLSHAPELEVKFFGDCYRTNDFNYTDGCQNVEEDVPLTFKLQLTLKEMTSKRSEQIIIKEKTINEDIEVAIDYVSVNCDCPHYDQSSILECVHGNFSCGSCICATGWQGVTCSEECKDDPRACRVDDNSRTCTRRGDCECGKCKCQKPYIGEFCQFECPMNKFGQICNAQGTCYEGVCTCRSGYTDDDCSCETSTDGCKWAGSDDICNNHGACHCNKCQCEDGYQGAYCEREGSQNNFCEIYEDYVKSFAENHTEYFHEKDVNILVSDMNDTNRCVSECTTIYFSGNAQRCFLDYCYRKGENNTVHLGTKNKSCIVTAQAIGLGAAMSALAAVILGGVIIILLRKWQINKADAAEYKKFVEESKAWNELNPIYKSPVSEFRNPMAR